MLNKNNFNIKKNKFNILIGFIIICCFFMIKYKKTNHINRFNKIIYSFKQTDNVNLSMVIV